jgi:hypothetical protein
VNAGDFLPRNEKKGTPSRENVPIYY